jgi:hypothetical protein
MKANAILLKRDFDGGLVPNGTVALDWNFIRKTEGILKPRKGKTVKIGEDFFRAIK